jgi:hypothetical protein
MGPYWINLAGIVCGLAMIVVALTNYYRPHPAWRYMILGLSLVLVATSVAAIRQHMQQRDDRSAQYAHISAEQDEVNKRLDALKSEIANDKGPADPKVVEERRQRLEKLQSDLNAIRKESDNLKKSSN